MHASAKPLLQKQLKNTCRYRQYWCAYISFHCLILSFWICSNCCVCVCTQGWTLTCPSETQRGEVAQYHQSVGWCLSAKEQQGVCVFDGLPSHTVMHSLIFICVYNIMICIPHVYSCLPFCSQALYSNSILVLISFSTTFMVHPYI